jgi:hypothetical protein
MLNILIAEYSHRLAAIRGTGIRYGSFTDMESAERLLDRRLIEHGGMIRREGPIRNFFIIHGGLGDH